MSALYKITFNPGGESLDVDPTEFPTQRDGKPAWQRDGQPGSILDIALGNDIDIDHACGGVNACSTCHVYVREGFNSCSEVSEGEEDMLDNAPGLSEFSRLACQAVPNGSCDIVVEIPTWNRNLVSESH